MKPSAKDFKKDKYDVDFSPTAKLPWVDKFVYSLNSGFSTNVSWVAFGYYLMYFYTDVLGISATIAGTIILGARVFDVFTDVIMGWAVDKFCFRWGKFRSWGIIGLVPMTVLFICVFTIIPTESMGVKIAWAAFTYGCFGAIAATLVFIPTAAQVTNMTKNVHERTSIGAWKSVFTNLSQIVVATMFMPLIMLFSGSDGNMPRGFFWAAVVLALLVAVIMLGSIAVTKKYELNADGSPREHLRADVKSEPITEQLKNLMSNRPAMILTIGIMIQYIMQAVKNGMIIYLFDSYFSIPDFLGVAMLVFTAGMVVGSFLMTPMCRLFKDTNRALLVTIILNIVVNMLFYIVASSMGVEAGTASVQAGVLLVLFILNGVLMGAYFSYANVLVPNTVDYGEWKTGKSQPGFIFALLGVCLTLGSAIGGQLMGVLLDSVGYVANSAQMPSTMDGMLMIGFIVPAVLMAVQFVIQCFFGLPDKKLAQYDAELQERRKAAGGTLAE